MGREHHYGEWGRQCEARKRNGFRCNNGGNWTVSYLEPEQPGVLRKRIYTYRCYAHWENNSTFPAGATQITLHGHKIVPPATAPSVRSLVDDTQEQQT